MGAGRQGVRGSRRLKAADRYQLLLTLEQKLACGRLAAHEAAALLADEFVRRGAIPGGLTWHFARPPVQGLDFEVDVRGVAHELVI